MEVVPPRCQQQFHKPLILDGPTGRNLWDLGQVIVSARKWYCHFLSTCQETGHHTFKKRCWYPRRHVIWAFPSSQAYMLQLWNIPVHVKDASSENSIMLEKSRSRAVWSINHWQKLERLGKSPGIKCWTFGKWYGWRSCSWSTFHTVLLLTPTSLATLRVLAWGFAGIASGTVSSS